MKQEIKTWFQLSILIFCRHLLSSLSTSSTGDKTAKIVTAASEVGIGGVVVAVAVVASVGKSVAVGAIQQPGVGLWRSVGISLSGSLPLLPAVVAVVVAKSVVAVVAGVGVGSVAVGEVAVAMGPVSVGAVEVPGIGLGLRIGFSFRFGLSFPLLPGLLHSSGLSSRSNSSRDDSEGNDTTVGARHHGTGFVLASGSGCVDDGSVGVGHDGGRCCGVGEGSPVGVGKVVAGGVGERWVGLGPHGGDGGNEQQELHDDDGAQKMC